MRPTVLLAATAALLSACDGADQPAPTPIKVASEEQQQMHKLNALNLAIALKRAIYDAGQTCTRVTDAGFAAIYQNLDMWVAKCAYQNGAERSFAVFTGPDGSAQVRDCADVDPKQMPACEIKTRPAGKFDGSE